MVNATKTAVKPYYGKLPGEELSNFDTLLLKMKRRNRANLKRKIIRRNEIVPLNDDEYVLLWGYIRHCCQLVANWKNVCDAIKVVASQSGRQFSDVMDECVDSMSIHVYTYAWRKYRHSADCAYVFSTAEYGFKSWIEGQNKFILGVDAAVTMHQEDLLGGRKVSCASMA